MKKMILTCALLTCVTMASMAQDQQNAPQPAQVPQGPQMSPAAGPGMQRPPMRPMPTPENMAERKAKNWERLLTLTADQYKGIYAAELDFAKFLNQARTSGTRPGPDQFKQANTDKDAKFKSILTAEQWTKYDAVRPKMPPTPPPPPASAPAPPAGK